MNKAQQQFGEPNAFIRAKVKSSLDPVVQEFIGQAPFAVMATSNAHGDCDASPKGGDPGFIKVLNEKTLLIPDFSGNKLFQSYENIEGNPKVGLIFLIPGCGLTVRVNGKVRVIEKEELRRTTDFAEVFGAEEEEILQQALLLDVEEAYPHCPRAFMFSKLWDTEIIQQNQISKSEQFWFAKYRDS
ncbi:MAG: pyridoxamine 5'-phosphate oxidase family protein [Gammaproteobacteria bacterium]|nr:pyridoxamine 5'-phosphate oxidase family protein [Gammaproteobacteria bacterium]